MKICIVILLLAFGFLSCNKVDKSTLNSPCSDSCTIIQGRVITGNNQGVANVPIEIKSESRSTLGISTSTRRIATGTTNSNGFYSLTFGLNKDEYGKMPRASLQILFSIDKAKFLPITFYELFGYKDYLYGVAKKDTVIQANIYYATRARIKIRLENFNPIISGDEFSVITSCDVGLERKEGSGGFINAINTITEGEIDACGNEETNVILRKKKNGVYTSEVQKILTPVGEVKVVTFVY